MILKIESADAKSGEHVRNPGRSRENETKYVLVIQVVLLHEFPKGLQSLSSIRSLSE